MRGQAHILPAPADGQRQLLVGHHHLDALGSSSSTTLETSAGASALTTKDAMSGVHWMMSIFSPCSSLTTAWDAAAAHADAGADRIDRTVLGTHRDLGAAARIAGNGNHLDHAIVDFGHFLAEEARHELGMGCATGRSAGRAVRGARHRHRRGPGRRLEDFARQRLVAADDAFAAAQVDDDVAVLHPLDGAMHDFADAVLVVLVHALALGIAHLLHDHLLGVLRGDAAELDGRQRFGDLVAHAGRRVTRLRIDQADLGGVVLHLVDNQQQTVEAGLAGARIDLGADLVLDAIACLGRGVMASAMASSTTDLSIVFSRATASAICKSSSLLALTAGSAIVFAPLLRDLVFVDVGAVAIALLGQALAGRFNQLIGQCQLGFGNVAEGHADQHRVFR